MVKKPAEPRVEEQATAEQQESARLKALAFKREFIYKSRQEAKIASPVPPGLLAHSNADIVNKSANRLSKRFLFQFPGRLNLCGSTGAKFGDLTNLSTSNPVLYVDYPNGRLKLCGTLVYPKNKYLAIKYRKKAKKSSQTPCLESRGTFDALVVFPEFYWIGTKEKNPDEKELPLPDELLKKPEGFSDTSQLKVLVDCSGYCSVTAHVRSALDGKSCRLSILIFRLCR